jgi:phospholipid-binding lipoprotein MlaA
MKRLSLLALLLVLLTVGCGHSPSPVSSLSSPAAPFQLQLALAASDSVQIPLKFSAVSAPSGSRSLDDQKNLNEVPEGVREDTAKTADPPESSKPSEKVSSTTRNESPDRKENLQEEEMVGEEKEATIADPLEPVNRAMFQFNDKLYFWVLKPASKGYSKAVPEPVRISVKNVSTNLAFPIRFVSSLLQADFSGAAAELRRFAVNTIWGVGGLLDPSSSQQLNLPKGDAELGQTLGVYGLRQGFYLVLPILGPSSARDSVGMVGNYFLYPVSYISPWYAPLGVRAYEEVNDTSLRIGEYESLKEAAIDPYVALRDAYAQYRQKKVEARRGKPEPPKPGGVR